MDPDYPLGMIQRQDRRHPRAEVVAARTIAGIPKLRHEAMPTFRDVPVVDADLGRTRRESIPGQGGYDHVEVFEHRQHVHVVEEAAGPAVREDERHTVTRCGTLIDKVDALPGEVVERVELPFPGTPVELIGPVGNEAPQPVQLGALFPAYAGYLVGPSCVAQACPQIVEHLIRDVNPKWFHNNNSLWEMAPQPAGRLVRKRIPLRVPPPCHIDVPIFERTSTWR